MKTRLNLRALWVLGFAIAGMSFFIKAHAGSVTLSCTPPVDYADSTAITDLAGFRIYYGTAPTALSRVLAISSPSTCGGTVSNLAVGTWYFAMTAYTSAGAESVDSSVVSKVIDAAPPTCPAAPANESRTQSCVAPTTGTWTQTHGWTAAASPACWTANAWTPATAPAGACVTPPSPPLVTNSPYSYEPTGTASAPTMSAIGLVASGLTCGPAVRQIGAVKFCEIQRSQTDLIGWPVDKTLAGGIWARAK